jgi:hypothetical protein
MYKVTITFTQVVPVNGGVDAGGTHYTEETEIYSQSVEDLDIQGVIAAVNKPDLSGSLRPFDGDK